MELFYFLFNFGRNLSYLSIVGFLDFAFPNLFISLPICSILKIHHFFNDSSYIRFIFELLNLFDLNLSIKDFLDFVLLVIHFLFDLVFVLPFLILSNLYEPHFYLLDSKFVILISNDILFFQSFLLDFFHL